MLGRIPFFKYLVLVTVSQVALADTIISDADRALADQAKSLQEIPMTVPTNIHAESATKEALSVFNEIKQKHLNGMQAATDPKEADKILVFVSRSLGVKALEDIALSISNTDRAVMVFRGFEDETRITEEMFELQRMASKTNPVASISLAPNLFRDYKINKVPTIVALDDEGSKELARVAGLTSPQWIENQIKTLDEPKDYGVKGPVEEISERDLIELMQERVAKIDWEEKKEQAIKRYWHKQDFISLPRADKPRLREIDPTIVITQTMRTPEGTVIHPMGTRINPLKMRGFNQALVVFNPLDKKQLPLVDEELVELKKKYDRITLIATEFDKSEGWDSYTDISNRFEAPIFKLTPDVLSRFELQKVPSIVTAKQFKFIVKELAEIEDED